MALPLLAAPKKKIRPAMKATPSAAKTALVKPTTPPPAPLLLAVFNDEQFLRITGVDDLGGERIRLRLYGGGTLEISTANLSEIVYEEPALRPENLPLPKKPDDSLPPFAVPPALDAMIRVAARDAGLDYALVVSLIKVESNFNPAALSHKGAQGLMQLIPATARRFKVAHPFRIEENLAGGCAYLKLLLAMFPDNRDHAIAAYNAGENAVTRHGGIPPFTETKNYVKRINGYLNSFQPRLDPAPPPRLDKPPAKKS